jgi:hypothetical protein
LSKNRKVWDLGVLDFWILKFASFCTNPDYFFFQELRRAVSWISKFYLFAFIMFNVMKFYFLGLRLLFFKSQISIFFFLFKYFT